MLKQDGGDDENRFDVELRHFSRFYEAIHREDAQRRHIETSHLVGMIGGVSRRSHRERSRAARAIVAEFYSPPRIIALARELPGYGIASGLALDLTTHDAQGRPWDFSKAEMRAEAERLFEEQKPTLRVGTPMCTAFSSWQFISDPKRDLEIVEKEKAAG